MRGRYRKSKTRRRLGTDYVNDFPSIGRRSSHYFTPEGSTVGSLTGSASGRGDESPGALRMTSCRRGPDPYVVLEPLSPNRVQTTLAFGVVTGRRNVCLRKGKILDILLLTKYILRLAFVQPVRQVRKQVVSK